MTLFDRVFLSEGVKKLGRRGEGLVASGYEKNVAGGWSGKPEDYPAYGDDFTKFEPAHAVTPRALYKAHSAAERKKARREGGSREAAQQKAAEKAELEMWSRERWQQPQEKHTKAARKHYQRMHGGAKAVHFWDTGEYANLAESLYARTILDEVTRAELEAAISKAKERKDNEAVKRLYKELNTHLFSDTPERRKEREDEARRNPRGSMATYLRMKREAEAREQRAAAGTLRRSPRPKPGADEPKVVGIDVEDPSEQRPSQRKPERQIPGFRHRPDLEPDLEMQSVTWPRTLALVERLNRANINRLLAAR